MGTTFAPCPPAFLPPTQLLNCAPQILLKFPSSSLALLLHSCPYVYVCNPLSSFRVTHIYMFSADHLEFNNTPESLFLEKSGSPCVHSHWLPISFHLHILIIKTIFDMHACGWVHVEVRGQVWVLFSGPSLSLPYLYRACKLSSVLGWHWPQAPKHFHLSSFKITCLHHRAQIPSWGRWELNYLSSVQNKHCNNWAVSHPSPLITPKTLLVKKTVDSWHFIEETMYSGRLTRSLNGYLRTWVWDPGLMQFCDTLSINQAIQIAPHPHVSIVPGGSWARWLLSSLCDLTESKFHIISQEGLLFIFHEAVH